MISEEDIQLRKDAIRLRHYEKLQAKEHELREKHLNWTAEAELSVDDVNFLYEITDYTDLNVYVIKKLEEYYIDISLWNKISTDEKEFKIKHLIEIIKNKQQTRQYRNKEKLRKKTIRKEEKLRKQLYEQECIRKRQSISRRLRIQRRILRKEEIQRRQKIIDDTNKYINDWLPKNSQHTFTNLTLSDWDKFEKKSFVVKEKTNPLWCHYYPNQGGVSFRSNNVYHNSYKETFTADYEGDSVPFCTKCPICKSHTKINYLDQIHSSAENITNGFNEVYCENNHYFYDSGMDKHYISSPDGTVMHNPPGRPKTMAQCWRYICWNLQSTSGAIKNKWKEWDPSDPDGKKAEAEKKRKEAEALQAQIAEL